MFNLNYTRLLTWLLPVLQPQLVAYVNALIAPVQVLYTDFLAKRQQTLYKIEHNAQVCYFQAALNDSFDIELRRITITNGFRFPQGYIYTDGELKPKYIWTVASGESAMIVYMTTEHETTAVDYQVNVPLELKDVISIFELQAQIEEYNLASKRYQIVFN